VRKVQSAARALLCFGDAATAAFAPRYSGVKRGRASHIHHHDVKARSLGAAARSPTAIDALAKVPGYSGKRLLPSSSKAPYRRCHFGFADRRTHKTKKKKRKKKKKKKKPRLDSRACVRSTAIIYPQLPQRRFRLSIFTYDSTTDLARRSRPRLRRNIAAHDRFHGDLNALAAAAGTGRARRRGLLGLKKEKSGRPDKADPISYFHYPIRALARDLRDLAAHAGLLVLAPPALLAAALIGGGCRIGEGAAASRSRA